MQVDRFTAAGRLLLAVDRHSTPLAEANGQRIELQAFSVYGTRSAPGPLVGTLGFNGEYLERTGLYLPGSYRAYSPALRRFCQADNLSPFGAGGVNAYAWCLGDPVNGVDPDGHFAWIQVFIGSLALTLGGATGAALTEGDARIALILTTAIGVVGMGASALKLRVRNREPSVLASYTAPANPRVSDPPPPYPPPLYSSLPGTPNGSRPSTPDFNMAPPSYAQAGPHSFIHQPGSARLAPAVRPRSSGSLSSMSQSSYSSFTSRSSSGSSAGWQPWLSDDSRASSPRPRARQVREDFRGH